MEEYSEDIINFLRNNDLPIKIRKPDRPDTNVRGVQVEWNYERGCIVIGNRNSAKDLESMANLIIDKPGLVIKKSNNDNITKEGPCHFIQIINPNKNNYFPDIEDFEKVVNILLDQYKDIPPKKKHGGWKYSTIDKNNKKNQDIEQIELTSDEIQIINTFCGHGELKEADIIFFGNEEGIDRKNVQEAIDRRVKEVDNHCKLISEDYLNGHYKKIKDQHDDDAENRNVIQMIQFQCRLLLHLNDQESNWFLYSNDDRNNWKKILDYHFNHIYREVQKFKYKSALTELRPLPRRNENEWPFKTIDRDEYIKAFTFWPQNCNDKQVLSIKNQRVRVLKNVFKSAKELQLIVGIGDIESKRNFFSMNYSVKFTPERIGDKTIQVGKFKPEEKEIPIVLSDFFGNGKMSLSDMANLAKYLNKIGF